MFLISKTINPSINDTGIK